MRKLIVLCALVGLTSCQKNIEIPTTDELTKNPQLLADWQARCETGEYSHLPADQRDNFCFTTREAARSVAIKKINGI